MAQRTSPKAARPDQPREVVRAETGAPAQFHFHQFGVVRALFQELPKVPLREGEQATQGLRTNLGAKVMVGGGRAEVRLSVTLLPDPHAKPYEIQVEVVGNFSIENGTDEQLGAFCRINAPTILFPYVRELVSRISADGRYGPIRLNPTNVAAILKEDNWSSESALLGAQSPDTAAGHPAKATTPAEPSIL